MYYRLTDGQNDYRINAHSLEELRKVGFRQNVSEGRRDRKTFGKIELFLYDNKKALIERLEGGMINPPTRKNTPSE